MNIQDFKRILVSFADNASEVEVNKGRITAFIRGDLVEAELKEKEGELYVIEDGVERKALIWISLRLAQLDGLAQRILDYVDPIKDFINPTGKILEDIETDPSETEKNIEDVCGTVQVTLNKRIAGTTSVVYLTSDAGEGKTTIINQLSRNQAELYKKKQTSWLLVPIPLGGRPFLRFDDIVIASLVNRFRFRFFYYESFIELVKLGLIVPAFDGFEEMFMENSSGEALSATGHLMAKLNSSGSILIAARHAYFDYKNFTSQAKLFDTIGPNSVSFSKVAINRWNREQFINYAEQRGISEGKDIYDIVTSKLEDPKHPLLTRPVLVSRLLEVVKSLEDVEKIELALDNSSEYFFNFVDAIIKREVELKWIDTSGEPYKPLLTLKQHHKLLSIVAEEMWLNSTDSLPFDIIDLLADLYSESQGFNVRVSSQVKERLKQHALLIKSDQTANHLKFDHEEFMFFFLGIALYRTIKNNRVSDFKNIMRKGALYRQTIEAVVASCTKDNIDVKTVICFFDLSQVNEGPVSFIKENCGILSLKILSACDTVKITLEQYSFPPNSLSGLSLEKLTIKKSHFQPTTLDSTRLQNCLFEDSIFEGFELDEEHIEVETSTLKQCRILFVSSAKNESSYYDPPNIERLLTDVGFSIENGPVEQVHEEHQLLQQEEDLKIVEKALRRFIRGSHLNDNVFRIRLGPNAEYFMKDLLPELLESNIMEEIDHQGAGQKRRFKLVVPFDQINDALRKADGSFEKFLKITKEIK